MWLLYAEAFGAMLILVLIVWWTMFHGRHNGERRAKGAQPPALPPALPPSRDTEAARPDDR